MTKLVILNEEDKICASVISHTGAEHRRLANRVMEEALKQASLSFNEISYVIATGYGRINVPFADRQITELTCHARGVANLLPTVRLAIDIGGQDAKGLKIDGGKLIDFVMNDKCAAGTGRFLETCTIFARQEVVSHISEGVPIEDIVAGLHNAIASRVARMVTKLKIERDVVFTGGVAMNKGVVKALEENLGCEIFVPAEPLLSGALGAALLGKEITLKALAKGEPVQRGERCLEEATFFQTEG